MQWECALGVCLLVFFYSKSWNDWECIGGSYAMGVCTVSVPVLCEYVLLKYWLVQNLNCMCLLWCWYFYLFLNLLSLKLSVIFLL